MRRDVEVEMSPAILIECCSYAARATPPSAGHSSFPLSHSSTSWASCMTASLLTSLVDASPLHADLNFATRKATSLLAECGTLLQVLPLRRFFFRGVDRYEDELRTARFAVAASSAASSSELASSVDEIAAGRFLLDWELAATRYSRRCTAVRVLLLCRVLVLSRDELEGDDMEGAVVCISELST